MQPRTPSILTCEFVEALLTRQQLDPANACNSEPLTFDVMQGGLMDAHV